MRTRSCAYQGVRNVSFLENFAYVLNGWSLAGLFDQQYDLKEQIEKEGSIYNYHSCWVWPGILLVESNYQNLWKESVDNFVWLLPFYFSFFMISLHLLSNLVGVHLAMTCWIWVTFKRDYLKVFCERVVNV